MTITIKKEHVTRVLLVLGCLLGIIGLFYFFAPGIVYKRELLPGNYLTGNYSMFDCMFGATYHYEGYPNEVIKGNGGLITLFVFQIMIMILIIASVVLFFMKKLNKKTILILSIVTCVLLLVNVILAFCTRSLFINSQIDYYISKYYPSGTVDRNEVYKLVAPYYLMGSAPILYGILGLVGIASLGTGSYLYYREINYEVDNIQ